LQDTGGAKPRQTGADDNNGWICHDFDLPQTFLSICYLQYSTTDWGARHVTKR
jgi:hypothetical protein